MHHIKFCELHFQVHSNNSGQVEPQNALWQSGNTLECLTGPGRKEGQHAKVQVGWFSRQRRKGNQSSVFSGYPVNTIPYTDQTIFSTVCEMSLWDNHLICEIIMWLRFPSQVPLLDIAWVILQNILIPLAFRLGIRGSVMAKESYFIIQLLEISGCSYFCREGYLRQHFNLTFQQDKGQGDIFQTDLWKKPIPSHSALSSSLSPTIWFQGLAISMMQNEGDGLHFSYPKLALSPLIEKCIIFCKLKLSSQHVSSAAHH